MPGDVPPRDEAPPAPTPLGAAATPTGAAVEAEIGAPAFGAYAPGAPARVARRLADATGDGVLGKLARSGLFTFAGGRRKLPRDVAVFASERARLHPYDNLCEKRVYRSERHWDRRERAFIAERVRSGTGPCRFLDVGANVGLYTLAARSAARAAGRPFRAAAIEPQPTLVERLRFNLAASGAAEEVVVLAWAAAAASGTVTLAASTGNRGAAGIAAEGVAVPARPLAEALTAAGFDRLDLMKIDIEGQEAPVLTALFDAVAPKRWPAAIVIEAARGDVALPGPALCREHGYRVVATTRMNALLAR